MPNRPDLDDLAARLEPETARRVRGLLDTIKDSATLISIERLLRAGDVEGVLRLLGVDAQSAQVMAVRGALREAAAAGATATAARFPIISVGFDILNPRTVQFMQDYEFNLVRQLTQTTREGVRAMVHRSLLQGVNPRVAARDIKASIGLTQKQTIAVDNFRRELETFHRKRTAGSWNLGGKISRAAGGAQTFDIDENGNPLDGIGSRRLRDFRFDGTLKNAMENGKPLTKEQIDNMVTGYRRKMVKWRSDNIARSETLRAVHVGADQQWQQAIESGVIEFDELVRYWVTARDERLCPICAPIPRMNQKGVQLGTPFKTPSGPRLLPPVHPSCRCTVVFEVL